ncbi:MAG: nitroreductase family protein [Bacteroidales bacterium]|nr:nitroreductase family protein [Bacteroidales bacterium]
MSKSILSRFGDVTKILNRASFADIKEKITKYEYGSDAFMQILKSRYSCHSFTNYPVSDSKLGMILEAGRLAPSAKNLQPTRIWVVKSEEALARLRTVHPCYGAPVVLIVGCRNEEAWVRESDGINSAKTDAAIVLTHLMLTATDAGLANMWIWDFSPGKIREAFPEMREHGIYGMLAIGYPAEGEGNPTELHNMRKSIEEIVTTL